MNVSGRNVKSIRFPLFLDKKRSQIGFEGNEPSQIEFEEALDVTSCNQAGDKQSCYCWLMAARLRFPAP